MKITLDHDNGSTYIWRTNDDILDLERMLVMIDDAIQETKNDALHTATLAQKPLEIQSPS